MFWGATVPGSEAVGGSGSLGAQPVPTPIGTIVPFGIPNPTSRSQANETRGWCGRFGGTAAKSFLFSPDGYTPNQQW